MYSRTSEALVQAHQADLQRDMARYPSRPPRTATRRPHLVQIRDRIGITLVQAGLRVMASSRRSSPLGT
jgi:hypothetical protein